MSYDGRARGQVIEISTGRRLRPAHAEYHSILYLCTTAEQAPMVPIATGDSLIPTEVLSTLAQLRSAVDSGRGDTLVLVEITPNESFWVTAARWLEGESGVRWIGVLADFDSALQVRAFKLGAFDVILRSQVRGELESSYGSGLSPERFPVSPGAHAGRLYEMPGGFWQGWLRAIHWNRRSAD